MGARSVTVRIRAFWRRGAVLGVQRSVHRCRAGRRGGERRAELPPTVTVGDTGIAATIELRNTNTDADAARPTPSALRRHPRARPAPGITMIPSCSRLGPFSACTSPIPACSRISDLATGADGDRMRGMTFNVSLDRPGERAVLHAQGGTHVTLPGAGASAGSSSRSACSSLRGRREPGDARHPDRAGRATTRSTGRAARVRARHQLGVTVEGAQPTIATTASGPTSGRWPVTDTATVAGLVNPAGGTVDFRLYGPDDATCARRARLRVARPAADATAPRPPSRSRPRAAASTLARVLQRRRQQPAGRGACNDAGGDRDGHAPAPGRDRGRPAGGDRGGLEGPGRSVRQDRLQPSASRSTRTDCRASRSSSTAGLIKTLGAGARFKLPGAVRFGLKKGPSHAQDHRPRRGWPDRPARDVLPLQEAGGPALRGLMGWTGLGRRNGSAQRGRARR